MSEDISFWQNFHRKASESHADHYKSVLVNANRLFNQGGDSLKEGLVLFDSEKGNIENGFMWADINKETDRAATKLCNSYLRKGGWCLFLRLPRDQHVRWLQSAIRAARILQDRDGEGMHLSNLGTIYQRTGKMHDAISCLEDSLAIARETNDAREIGHRLANIGNIYSDLGDINKAIEYHGESVDVLKTLNDARDEANALLNFGNDFIRLKKANHAIKYYNEALIICRNLGDRLSEERVLTGLGTAYHMLGNLTAAIENHEEQLTIAREIGDKQGVGSALDSLITEFAEAGKLDKAIDFHKQALIAFREIGDRLGEVNADWSLGIAYIKMDNLSNAVPLLESSVEYQHEIGHAEYELRLELVDTVKGMIARGESMRESENIVKAPSQLPDLYAENFLVFPNDLKDAYAYSDKAGEFMEMCRDDLIFSRERGDQADESVALANLGIAYAYIGKHDRATKYHDKAIELARLLRDPDLEYDVLDKIVRYFEEEEYEPERALKYSQQMYRLERYSSTQKGASRNKKKWWQFWR